MSLFFVLLLLALIAGGVYVYQRLRAIEREIRAEQLSLKEDQGPVGEEDRPAPVPVAPAVSVAADGSLESQILDLVEASPGLSQTDLYGEFSDSDRREIQKLLREMDQQGRLRREKKGSSYRLHPL